VERMLHGYIIPEENLMQLYDSDMEAINGLKEKEALAYEYALKSLEMIPTTFNGITYTVGITIFTGYVSMVADMILETNEVIDILILINLQYNTISLRTKRTDIDLSYIASKYFNGGGHPQAAGASLTAAKKYLIANAILGIIKE
jgi:oligoribonuclease NrnB/cAMP/cGMP phosphodiesterase (DHH superfamily)